MDCCQFEKMLDDYIDCEPAEDKVADFLAHAQECASCREALEAAKMLREVMPTLDDEIVVPLEAQANWRSAVRAEAKRRANRKWMRIASVSAAVLALVFCGTVLTRTDLFERKEAILPESNAAELMIASDSMSKAVTGDEAASAQGDVYSAWRKIETERYDEACATIEALTDEYSGSCGAESFSPPSAGCMYRIEIPYEYMSDFLNAADRLGAVTDSETVECGEETAVIYIELNRIE